MIKILKNLNEGFFLEKNDVGVYQNNYYIFNGFNIVRKSDQEIMKMLNIDYVTFLNQVATVLPKIETTQIMEQPPQNEVVEPVVVEKPKGKKAKLGGENE